MYGGEWVDGLSGDWGYFGDLGVIAGLALIESAARSLARRCRPFADGRTFTSTKSHDARLCASPVTV